MVRRPRDFQTLHIDFGLPLIPGAPVDVARFTALYIRADAAPVHAITRLVSLRSLLSAARWPARDELLQRFADYGHSHGAWESERGYVEGSLARIVEAAQGQRPVLPSVKATVGFRCGLEFAALDAESAFFAERGLPLHSAEDEARLAPGQLLVFDNLAVAHGRRGQRRPGELHQRVFGDRATLPERQIELRDRALAALWVTPRLTPGADEVVQRADPDPTLRLQRQPRSLSRVKAITAAAVAGLVDADHQPDIVASLSSQTRSAGRHRLGPTLRVPGPREFA